MNSTLNNMLWFMAIMEELYDNKVVNSLVKFMGTLLVVSGLFSGLSSDDALFRLGCAASILFGFLLQTTHLSRRKKLSKWLIFSNVVTTSSIVFLAFLFWNAKYGNDYGDWFMLYLFLCSFTSIGLSEIIFNLTKKGANEYLSILARKFLSETDKKEDEA